MAECRAVHLNHPQVSCSRQEGHADEGAGPHARVVTLEWELDYKTGRVTRSAIVNGRIEDRIQEHSENGEGTILAAHPVDEIAAAKAIPVVPEPEDADE